MRLGGCGATMSSTPEGSLELLKLSLSQRHAKQKLLDGVSEQLQLERRRHAWLPCIVLLALAEPGSLQTLLSAVLLLLCSVSGCARP